MQDVRTTLKNGDFSNNSWSDLGLELGLSQRTLEDIEANKSRVDERLRECLVKWLERADEVDEKGGATWAVLANALERIGQKATADHISELMYITVCYLCTIVTGQQHCLMISPPPQPEGLRQRESKLSIQ